MSDPVDRNILTKLGDNCMNEKEIKNRVVKYLGETHDHVIPEVHVGGSRIKELSGAPKGIFLDAVAVKEDGSATIYEVKYNYTAVMVGQALGQLLAYSELLKDEEIFRVFCDKVKRKTSIEVKPQSLDYVAIMIETQKYPSTGINGRMIDKVKLPKTTCVWTISEEDL